MKNLFLLLGLSIIFTLQSCIKEPANSVLTSSPDLPIQEYDYKTNAKNIQGNRSGRVIDDFPNGNSFGSFENPEVTDAGATLGRVLFYDQHLSLNNAISCASCHKQAFAFADPVTFSTGFEGRLTTRNSMAVINSGMNDNLFWDSRANSVVDLTLQPISNHIEMGIESMASLQNKLTKLSYYKDLFRNAFGSDEISKAGIASAISQFLCSMTSFNSKFDQGEKAIHKFSNFTELEDMGKNIFFSERAKCALCHSGTNFNAPEDDFSGYGSPDIKGTANIGLEIVYADKGKEDGKFKIPTLRNIALTGPYMHDGRFNSLMDVINHYSEGIQFHNELDEKFRNSDGTVKALNFNEVEKKALIAFLKTLTDETYITDVKFSNPFKD